MKAPDNLLAFALLRADRLFPYYFSVANSAISSILGLSTAAGTASFLVDSTWLQSELTLLLLVLGLRSLVGLGSRVVEFLEGEHDGESFGLLASRGVLDTDGPDRYLNSAHALANCVCDRAHHARVLRAMA